MNLVGGRLNARFYSTTRHLPPQPAVRHSDTRCLTTAKPKFPLLNVDVVLTLKRWLREVWRYRTVRLYAFYAISLRRPIPRSVGISCARVHCGQIHRSVFFWMHCCTYRQQHGFICTACQILSGHVLELAAMSLSDLLLNVCGNRASQKVSKYTVYRKPV